MIIKCLKCGHENQLGAIFCRACGAKLEINDLRPEVKDKKKQGCFKTGCKIFVVLFLLLVSAVVFILFFPLSYTEYAPFPEKEKAALDEKLDNFTAALQGKNKMLIYTFTPAEASYAINQAMRKHAGSPDELFDVVVETREDTVSIILQKKFMGVLRFRMELRCRPELKEGQDGTTIFEPNLEYFKFGNIPSVSFTPEKIMDKLEDEGVKEIINKVKKFQIDKDGNFEILLKKPAASAAPAASK